MNVSIHYALSILTSKMTVSFSRSPRDVVEEEKRNYLKEIPGANPEWPPDVTTLYRSLRDQLFKHDIRVRDVIEGCGYRNNNISTKFKVFVGLPPKEWLIEHRLEVARRLLTKHSLSITEVSFAVGYENPSSFSKIFKSREECTPSNFQERSKE